jgi:hypothetical protein
MPRYRLCVVRTTFYEIEAEAPDRAWKAYLDADDIDHDDDQTEGHYVLGLEGAEKDRVLFAEGDLVPPADPPRAGHSEATRCERPGRRLTMDETLIPVTSLAGLRRAVATPGVLITALEHWQPHLVGVVRRPETIQRNAFAWIGKDRNGQEVRLWCYYPPAKDLAFNPDGTVTFYPGTEKSWRLRFATEA